MGLESAPYSHLSFTKYAARHAFVLGIAFLIPWRWRSMRGRCGAGRLDWNLQDDALPRKQYVIRAGIQSQEKSSQTVVLAENRHPYQLDAIILQLSPAILTLKFSISCTASSTHQAVESNQTMGHYNCVNN